MTQPGLLRFFGGLFSRPTPHRQYSFDPVHPSLFNSPRTTTPCDEESRPRIGAVLRGPPIAPSVCERSERVSFSAAEILALAVDVDNQTQLSVTGVDSDNYAVRFCAQAGGPSEDDARRSLEKITFTRSGQTLKARKPRHSREQPASAWLHIDAARHRAISLKGSYSYMELFGIDAPVQVSTTHARLKMIEISDTVRATARVGIIDFAGDRGRIQLEADGEIGEINLKFAAPLFDGTVHAEAEVAIRVLLHPKSESPFEAIVDREDLFVCRADIAPHVRRHDYEGCVVFTYGIGDPVLRLVSRGALVIDSIDRLPSKSR